MTASSRPLPSVEAAGPAAGVMAFMAIAAACLYGAVGYAGRAAEPYSPLNHWISELGEPGVAAHADVFNLLLSLGGILFIGFVLALWSSSPGRLRWVYGPVGVAAGTAGALVGRFPMDHPSEHVLAAGTFFNLGWMFVALASIAFVRRRDARFPAWLAVVGAATTALVIAFTVSLQTDSFSRERMAADGPITGRPDVWIAPILEWAALVGIMAWVLLTSIAWWRELRRSSTRQGLAGQPA